MLKYILKRFAYMLLTLLVVTTITFFLVHAIPGDPLTAMVEDMPEETRAVYMAKWGFDQPILVQYGKYMGQLFRFDLGASLRYPGRLIATIVKNYAPVSARIGGLALLIGISIGIALGILAALKKDKWPDRVVMVIAILGTSIPTFVFTAVLQYFLTVKLKLFPTTGYKSWRHLVLPVFCMCLGPIASYARYMRSSILDVYHQDYILTAEAKGTSGIKLIFRHVLRNAIIPCVTMICVSVGNIFSGSFIIETVFAIPGLGRYFINAINDRDYFVVLGLNIIMTGIFICSILVSDILLAAIDPRIRTSFEKRER